MDNSTINFAVYEDGKECLGIAQATLPNLNALSQTISGAGISGNIDVPIIGQYEAMTLGLSFRNLTAGSASLIEPRQHKIDLRGAVQNTDPVKGILTVDSIKHVFKVMPKTMNGGTVAPATMGNPSGEYSVFYWAEYINGKKVLEIDPINNICTINGKDYMSDVRKALGK